MVFELLEVWLQRLPAIWMSGSDVLTMDVLLEQPGQQNHSDRLLALLAALKAIKTEQALEHAFRQSGNLDQFTRQMHTWFDAFRTLKLIHLLRDIFLPSISYAVLEANPVFKLLLTKDPDLFAFHEQLRKKLTA